MKPTKACLAATMLLLAPLSIAEPLARMAIIIDDLGYQLVAGRRVVDLEAPVTCAILPGTPRGRQLARAAHDSGKEVLLHLPLQATDHIGPVEPGRITIDTTRAGFAEAFRNAFESVPHAIGVNNHRGSLLTRHPGHMRWLMEEIQTRDGVFFIDSYTTHESVALQMAAEAGVVARKRDVFLDPDAMPETVAREFERLKSLALERGMAIGIGHPYPATLELLERELPRLKEAGIELVPVSELLL